MTDQTGIEIYPELLRDWLEAGRAVDVIDIRPSAEYSAWKIPGARNIDVYWAIHANDPGALADYQARAGIPVVLVCFSGQTSLIAARYLRGRGVPAMSLAGGMSRWSLAWNTAEVPLEASSASVIQVRRTGKGCLSYIIGSDGEALVIDASVEPGVYQHLAGVHQWQITQVLDTHIHADHLSRSRQLASSAGAEHLLPRQERTSFAYHGVGDGEVVKVGKARLAVLGTPGHTPESISLVLDGQALFTGDTLFIDNVGRPDLKADLPETTRRAHALYQSLSRLRKLDPRLIVLPCHASQPVAFNGQPLARPLEDVLKSARSLEFDEPAFVDWILSRLPPTPPHFEDIVGLNEAGEFPPFNPIRLEAGANFCAMPGG